jgi:hypothetical protein
MKKRLLTTGKIMYATFTNSNVIFLAPRHWRESFTASFVTDLGARMGWGTVHKLRDAALCKRSRP